MKKLICILTAFCLLFGLCGCEFAEDIGDSIIEKGSPKTFDFDGISIDLTTDFLRMDFISEDFDFVVGNEDLSVMGIKLEFGDTGIDEYSVSEFAQYYRELMADSTPSEITEIDKIPSFKYTNEEDGEEYTVSVMFYKADDCFWIVCFSLTSADYEEFYPDIVSYAKTVKCD